MRIGAARKAGAKAGWVQAQLEGRLTAAEVHWSTVVAPQPDAATEEAGSTLLRCTAKDPSPDPVGRAFTSAVVGGRVPKEYVKAVEAGCRDALLTGPLGGHPVTGVHVTLVDGQTHAKDSSELAFRTAGRLALQQALRQSTMALLEPIVEVTVTAPEDTVGAVLGDLASRRGRVTDSTARPGAAVVTATVPLAELFGYATRLRSRTQGRGTFTTRPAGYQQA